MLELNRSKLWLCVRGEGGGGVLDSCREDASEEL